MGIYTAALNIGSFLTSMVTAPLAELLGWRAGPRGRRASSPWRPLFSGCSAVGPRAAFVPSAATGRRTRKAAGSQRRRGWITAGLTAGFAGQAFSYYARDRLAAEPPRRRAGHVRLRRRRGVLAVPDPRHRWRPGRSLRGPVRQYDGGGVTLGCMWLAVPAGLLLAPELWWLWSISGGVAQGGGITLIFIAIIRLARDQASAGRMSATFRGSVTASLPWRRRSGLRPRHHGVLDAGAAAGSGVHADVHRLHHRLRAAGAEGR